MPVFLLVLFAVRGAAIGFGAAAPFWAVRLLSFVPLALAAEIFLRGLGIFFLPRPAPTRARAAIGSLLAGLLMGDSLRPSAIAARMREKLGIDVGQSWTFGFARQVTPPVILLLLLAAWGVSSVAWIGLDRRGAYERFGAPVAVLKPGLHLVLPWPLGRVRPVEYGVVHAVAIGVAAGAAPPADLSTADGPAPASANRLWDVQAGADNAYLIADITAGRQNFETVSADLRVLFRVGLSDNAARKALYGVADPDGLVRALADRLLARFFADRTLEDVVGARREQVADTLRAALQEQLDARRSGLEVVALVVESMHPPGGAAAAYRSVQAAEIVASTRRSEEIGRAHGTLSVARRDGHDAEVKAQASAAEIIGAATAESTAATADDAAYRDGGRAFLLERYFTDLRTGLGRAALEILDHRLPAQGGPLLDLRATAPIQPPPEATQ